MNQKDIDLILESQFANYLDKYVYPNIKNFQYKRISFFNNEGKNKQLKGIDLEANNGFRIDEKAQLSYIRSELKTFAFELNFINKKGDNSIGWLIDDLMETDYYFLARNIKAKIGYISFDKEKETFLSATRKKVNNLIKNQNQIIFSSCLLESLKKEKLIYKLSEINLTKNRLIYYVDSIRKLGSNYELIKEIIGIQNIEIIKNKGIVSQVKIEIKEIDKSEGIIYLSTYLSEKPLNLVLNNIFLHKCEMKKLWPTKI